MRTFTIEFLLRQWSLELAMYRRNKAIYDGHSAFYKFIKDLREPRHPGYHSVRLVDGASFVIEFGFYDKPILKCSDGRGGYKLDVMSGEKSPCLGARGMKINNDYLEEMVQNYADKIRTLMQPYINNI